MKAHWYRTVRLLYIIGIITFGTLGFITDQLIAEHKTFYPIFPTILMFLGESLNYVILPIRKKLCKPNAEPSRSHSQIESPKRTWLTRIGKFGYCIPGFLELLNSFLEECAYPSLTPALFLSLKTLTIFYLIFYRYFFVNRNIFPHQKLGILLYILGIISIAIEIFVDRLENDHIQIVSICMMIFAGLFRAFVLITQESLMIKLETSTEVVNGIKGITGLLLAGVLLVPSLYIFPNKLYHVHFYSPIPFFSNYLFILECIARILAICIFNFVFIKVQKFTEALTVASIDCGRIIFAWIVEIFLIKFNPIFTIEILGAIFILFGLLIYNEIVIVPCCGMKKSAEEGMEDNEIYRGDQPKNGIGVFFKMPTVSLLDSINSD